MDPELEAIIRGMIGAERSRRKTPTARAMVQVTEGVSIGHSYFPIALDQEAAREYEDRAKQWLGIVRRVVSESGSTWTPERASDLRQLLTAELLVDWEELVALLRSKTAARGDGRMVELEAAKDRVRTGFPHELELLVLAQDRGRVPMAEQLTAPRYLPVLLAWRKARSLLDGPQPDYPNAAKEAVSAVEQLARVVTGQATATLGDAIKDLRAAGRMNAFYIVPTSVKESVATLFMDHPPTDKRIAALQRIEQQLQGTTAAATA